ncbi:MAG: DNA primase catalytic subunit PriS [Methanosarcinales archaeon]|nr:MAG: DNA primase catalytic subunit PriS [Methanosarcinales archaeon]
MNFRTKSYLRKRFGDYYQTCELPLPHDFKRREWGFIFFDELPEVVMRRHKAFSSEGEAIEYLRGMVPAHVYHSAAYYQFPGAGTMKAKKWEGADLIFDLDADHLPQKARSYAGMLANVKAETGKLLDFLLEDFGFDEENIRVAFSGGRGYHIHVHDKRVLTLESAQRREIVDYLSGTGLTIDFLFKSERYVVYNLGKFKKKELVSPRKIISFDEVSVGFGWGRRISTYINSYMDELNKKDKKDALNDIISLIKISNTLKLNGVSDKTIKDILQLKEVYLFCWEDVPGNDNSKLLKFISDELGVVLEKNVRIEKSVSGIDINIYGDKCLISLELNKKKTNAAITINEAKTYNLIVRMENGKLNVYTEFTPRKIASKLNIPENIVSSVFIINGSWDAEKYSLEKYDDLMTLAKNSEIMNSIKRGIITFEILDKIRKIPYFFDAVVQKAIEDTKIHTSGASTDEPVTADIRRLIRMPSSLHGGSGMRVVPLTLSEFKTFEPLRDAVVFSEKEIQIEVNPPLKPQNSLVEMKGKSIKVVEGINIVPEYAGIYLMCRGAAEYA